MKFFLTEQKESALTLSCHELARLPLQSDEAVFSEHFFCDGIHVTLSSPIPEVEDVEGLATLLIPKIPDKNARRDWAGAVAFVFCSSQGIDTVGLRLSDEHVQTITLEDARRATLSAFRSLCHILHITPDSIQERCRRLDELRFPHRQLRQGQKTLMQEGYAAIRDGRNLFALAPTGIGKTLSVLYPAVKALAKGHIAKIFYLTPRGSLQPQVADAVHLLQQKDPFLHTITLSAKARICECEQRCAHSMCENKFMRRENEERALRRLFETYGHITPTQVQEVAREEGLCPFELSLSASLYADVIVCDYNYIFDPHAALKRYQCKEERYALLCDEAHNLVTRVRESFSAELSERLIAPIFTPLFEPFSEVQAAADTLRRRLRENRPSEGTAYDPISFSVPDESAIAANELADALCPITQKKSSKEFSKQLITTARDIYFALSAYLDAHADFDEHYALCTAQDGTLKILLVDPSQKVKSITRDAGMCIFFSATLSPKDYYLGMLGGAEEDFLDLPSPFDPQNLKILSCPISTFYHDRERTASFAAAIIAAAVRARVGNYMVFFPSFDYLNKVVEAYRRLRPQDLILCQTPQMSEDERSHYLSAFSVKRDRRLLGFAVMGGLFSEGVDLVGDQLLGEVIFGVGMPPPSPESEAVRRRFDERDEDGAALGYTYPGFNRVLQSAGRVIRTETDRGFLILCDERYLSEGFADLFPTFWQEPEPVDDPMTIQAIISAFWDS